MTGEHRKRRYTRSDWNSVLGDFDRSRKAKNEAAANDLGAPGESGDVPDMFAAAAVAAK